MIENVYNIFLYNIINWNCEYNNNNNKMYLKINKLQKKAGKSLKIYFFFIFFSIQVGVA
jgi:hypothetical protein